MINLSVVSASEQLFKGKVSHVTLPGSEGEFQVHPDHCPLISTLKPGTLLATSDSGEPVVIYIQSGIASIEHNCVSVLADCANKARDENEAELLEKQRLDRDSLHDRQEKVDYQMLLKQLAITNAMLQSIAKLRKIQETIK